MDAIFSISHYITKKRTQKGTAAVVNWLALSRIRGILMITSSLKKGQNEKKKSYNIIVFHFSSYYVKNSSSSFLMQVDIV